MEPISAAIAGSASLVGQGLNALFQGKMNKRAERFSREIYSKQRADSLSDWHMNNAYNDPSAQMSRLSNAGLNPNLVYGNGADAQSGGAPKPVTSHQPNFKAPNVDMSSVVQTALTAKQLQSNIARTDAETELIKSRTVTQNWENDLNRSIGIEDMTTRYKNASEQIEVNSKRANSEYQAWLSGTSHYVGEGSPAAKAAAAGFEKAQLDLDNAKKLGNLRDAELILKRFEGNLTKQGISPNSPWYVKILGDLLKTTTGMEFNKLGQY